MTGTSTTQQTRAAIMSASQGWLGVPYKWAGTTKNGVDCSGFTMRVYKDAAGISLPHFAAAQALSGKAVSQDAAQPGDLVFFGFPLITHCGIYMGGSTVRHAPHTGAFVRDESLASIASTVRLAGFRNYLGDVKTVDGGKATQTPDGLIPNAVDVTQLQAAADAATAKSIQQLPQAPRASGGRPRNASSSSRLSNAGFDWNPLNWPGDAISAATSDVEHAALEMALYGSLLGLGAGLVLVGAATTVLKATGSAGGGSTPVPIPV